MKKEDQTAIFRYGVLGALLSRNHIERGELKKLICEAANRDYDIPGSTHTRIAEKTIEAWYYKYQREELDGLRPKVRLDKGMSKLALDIQDTITQFKKENPKRSIDTIIELLESKGMVARGEVSRSSVHRLLKQHGISRMSGSSSEPEEFRSFEMEYANQMWLGDVMHGPRLMIDGRMRKVYLVSLMDDASRLLAHSAFCLGETALDIEGVLKQAVLKRGLPMKLLLDNGAAYRSGSLKGICARLGIRMIFCRPYAPEGKGKLERWHRTFRNQFLSELDSSRIRDLNDLNTRLWAWIEQVYHRRMHTSLKGLTPLTRYQQDLARIRTLGSKAQKLDELFYHRVSRKVRRDGTVAWNSMRFEVALERWHRTFRNQFLSELDSSRIRDLNDLNTRLWAWIEQVYHRRMHTSLKGLTPLTRYQQDLARIRTLGSKAQKLDELFYHRVSRKVRRDGTVAWNSMRFEVDYVLAGKQVLLVIDPHAGEALRVENDEGEVLSMVILLDVKANCHRRRRKPDAVEDSEETSMENAPVEDNLVERALEQYTNPLKGVR